MHLLETHHRVMETLLYLNFNLLLLLLFFPRLGFTMYYPLCRPGFETHSDPSASASAGIKDICGHTQTIHFKYKTSSTVVV